MKAGAQGDSSADHMVLDLGTEMTSNQMISTVANGGTTLAEVPMEAYESGMGKRNCSKGMATGRRNPDS